MADVPISDALIDSAQFQVDPSSVGTPGAGLVRLHRGPDGWVEKDHTGAINGLSPVSKRTVELLNTDIEALPTTPFVLVPGETGKVILPVGFVFKRVAGTAYATPGYLAVEYDASPGTRLDDDRNSSDVYGLDGTTESVTVAGCAGARDRSNSIIGSDVVFRTSGTPTGGTGSLFITTLYMSV